MAPVVAEAARLDRFRTAMTGVGVPHAVAALVTAPG